MLVLNLLFLLCSQCSVNAGQLKEDKKLNCIFLIFKLQTGKPQCYIGLGFYIGSIHPSLLSAVVLNRIKFNLLVLQQFAKVRFTSE